MDKLKAMQTFVAVADAGSLTGAARVLRSSLPAVVRSLAALERHLQTRLVNRTTRSLALTAEGRLYLGSCRQILTAVEEAEAALGSDASEPSGNLAITAPMLFGQLFVAPAVNRFVQRHPKVNCRLVLLDRVVNLLDEAIDVGIRIGHLADSTLVAQPLGSVRRLVVASPDYLSRHGRPRHPSDLTRANCLIVTAPTGSVWPFHEHGKKLNVNVTGNLEFNQVGPALDACVAGLGFGVFMSYQVAPLLRQGLLEPVLRAFEPPPRPVQIVYPQARLLPARTRRFIEAMKADLMPATGEAALEYGAG